MTKIFYFYLNEKITSFFLSLFHVNFVIHLYSKMKTRSTKFYKNEYITILQNLITLN